MNNNCITKDLNSMAQVFNCQAITTIYFFFHFGPILFEKELLTLHSNLLNRAVLAA